MRCKEKGRKLAMIHYKVSQAGLKNLVETMGAGSVS